MKTKTTYRTPSGTVGIEDDRRKKQLPINYETQLRNFPFTYGPENKIITLPVEPEPHRNLCFDCGHEFATCISNPTFGDWGKLTDAVISCDGFAPPCPYSPGDSLILTEEWIDGYTEDGIYTCVHAANELK